MKSILYYDILSKIFIFSLIIIICKIFYFQNVRRVKTNIDQNSGLGNHNVWLDWSLGSREGFIRYTHAIIGCIDCYFFIFYIFTNIIIFLYNTYIYIYFIFNVRRNKTDFDQGMDSGLESPQRVARLEKDWYGTHAIGRIDCYIVFIFDIFTNIIFFCIIFYF